MTSERSHGRGEPRVINGRAAGARNDASDGWQVARRTANECWRLMDWLRMGTLGPRLGRAKLDRPRLERIITRERTRTGRKNPGRQEIHRVSSGESPPPGTTQCKCG